MKPAKILIVEDDRVVARDIQQQLGRIGHAVVGITARGEDVLPLALSTQPEMVLMDIRLEGAVDGIDAAQQIREHCHIPVVFLTAYADDETVERASITEPFGYILKPFEDSQLRTVIEMALYKHTAERKLRESELRFVTTLSSIGDAVIAADNHALVTFLNPVAEALTGWSQGDAVGRPLADVFRIVDEESRQPVEDPAANVLCQTNMVGLANPTLLLALRRPGDPHRQLRRADHRRPRRCDWRRPRLPRHHAAPTSGGDAAQNAGGACSRDTRDDFR